MNPTRSWIGMTVVAAATFPLLMSKPSWAVNFGQIEVDQSRFVAVAVPRSSGYYNLLVVEQISEKKQCWRSSGSNPTQVEPLLLNFDFTGICGRSTDSNGYSIRIAGADKGLDYRLSLQKHNDDLVLVGIPSTADQSKPVEVGRTHGIKPGFLKIALSPGWRFAKRTYNGKKLGHVYFNRDSAAVAYQSEPKDSPSTSAKAIKPSVKPSASKPSTSKVFTSKSLTSKPSALKFLTSKSSASKVTTSKAATSHAGKVAYRVMVVAPNETQQTKLRSQRPGAFRTSYEGKAVMQVGLFGDRDKAESLKSELKEQGYKVLMISNESKLSSIVIPVTDSSVTDFSSPDLASSDPSVTPLSTLDSPMGASVGFPSSRLNLIAVPPKTPPLGNVVGAKDVYKTSSTVLPPPPPSPQVALVPRYRVIVKAKSKRKQAKVRSLVSTAFRSTYQDKPVMQVGAYPRLEEAEPIIQLMKDNGFEPITDRL